MGVTRSAILLPVCKLAMRDWCRNERSVASLPSTPLSAALDEVLICGREIVAVGACHVESVGCAQFYATVLCAVGRNETA